MDGLVCKTGIICLGRSVFVRGSTRNDIIGAFRSKFVPGVVVWPIALPSAPVIVDDADSLSCSGGGVVSSFVVHTALFVLLFVVPFFSVPAT